MKSELLVIVHKNGTVNLFPDLVHTARQAVRVSRAIRDLFLYSFMHMLTLVLRMCSYIEMNINAWLIIEVKS